MRGDPAHAGEDVPPALSVIVPAFDAAETLGAQLDALLDQDYRGEWEVVVVDNGSTDGTWIIASTRAGRHGRATVKAMEALAHQGAAYARNVGARAAAHDLLLFCDADDVVDRGWLTAMAKALGHHDVVAGALDHDMLNDGVERHHFRSHVTEAPIGMRYRPYAVSANFGVSRPAFGSVGGFPTDLDAVGEDVALSWSLQLAGYELHFAPDAVVGYRHRPGLDALWRQQRAYGFADAVLYARFRAAGVPRLPLSSALAAYGRLITGLPRLVSPRGRGWWVANAAKRWGRVLGSIRERVLYL